MNINKFCLDMDGVVADWVAGAAQIIGYRLDDPHTRYPDSDWHKLRSHHRLFRDLPKKLGADALVDLARRYRDDLGWELVFLTAIPHNNDMPWAFWDKVTWAGQHYPDIPVWFGPYSEDKQVHCSPGDILVDDRSDNCAQWSSRGGLAFKVANSHVGSVDVRAQVLEDYHRRMSMLRLRELNTQIKTV